MSAIFSLSIDESVCQAINQSIYLQYGRALLVLQECLRLRSNDPVALLQAAKLCYEHLGKVEKTLIQCNNVHVEVYAGYVHLDGLLRVFR